MSDYLNSYVFGKRVGFLILEKTKINVFNL